MNRLPVDPMLDQLSTMPPIAPDAVHTASVRARCHAALARQQRRREFNDKRWPDRGRLVELGGVAGFALFYVCLVIHSALAATRP